ncbi:MAG: GNAT family N-acetyltransferase, partial [Gemmatimonadaceae bacterium]
LEAAEGLGWVLGMPTGDDVCDVVGVVRREAAPACSLLDNEPFMSTPDIDIALGAVELVNPWGRAVFVALDDGRPLALAVVGWAHRRAYHLLEIVTRAGRERSAMTWLYAQIVRTLCSHGFTSYHLGGAPAAVADPRGEAYAFHRDRLGLGGVPVFNASARWVLDTAHAVRHRVAVAPREALAV